MDRDLALEGHDDRKKDKALDRSMKTAEHQAAVDLNYMKQMYSHLLILLKQLVLVRQYSLLIV